jgi:Cytosine deaminase and related metal-dependent hydrolases
VPSQHAAKPVVDQIISARWVIPVRPRVLLHHHALAIKQGRIVAIGPRDEIHAAYTAAENTSLDHHVLMPGFVNAHTHAAMTLMRGLADDLPLMTWLNEHIWPWKAVLSARNLSAWVRNWPSLKCCAAEPPLSMICIFSRSRRPKCSEHGYACPHRACHH